jgi:hypothetical protein
LCVRVLLATALGRFRSAQLTLVLACIMYYAGHCVPQEGGLARHFCGAESFCQDGHGTLTSRKNEGGYVTLFHDLAKRPTMSSYSSSFTNPSAPHTEPPIKKKFREYFSTFNKYVKNIH